MNRLIFIGILYFTTIFFFRSQHWYLRYYFSSPEGIDSVDFSLHIDPMHIQKEQYLECGSGKIFFQKVRRTTDSLFLEVRDFPMHFHFNFSIHEPLHRGICFNLLKKNWTGRVALVPFTQHSRIPSSEAGFQSLDVEFSFTQKLRGSILSSGRPDALFNFSILSPSGDFGYAEGFFKNNTVKIWSFNGNGFFLITGKKVQNQWSGNYLTHDGKNYLWKSVSKEEKKKHPVTPFLFSLPQGTFELTNGKTFTFHCDSLKNRPVVIHLLGSWCHNCRDEVYALKKWVNKYYPQGVFFAALCVEKQSDTSWVHQRIRFIKERWGIFWPVIPSGLSTHESPEKLFGFKEPLAYPATFFFNAEHQPVHLERTFSGPSTGIHFENWNREKEEILHQLIKK